MPSARRTSANRSVRRGSMRGNTLEARRSAGRTIRSRRYHAAGSIFTAAPHTSIVQSGVDSRVKSVAVMSFANRSWVDVLARSASQRVRSGRVAKRVDGTPEMDTRLLSAQGFTRFRVRCRSHANLSRLYSSRRPSADLTLELRSVMGEQRFDGLFGPPGFTRDVSDASVLPVAPEAHDAVHLRQLRQNLLCPRGDAIPADEFVDGQIGSRRSPMSLPSGSGSGSLSRRR